MRTHLKTPACTSFAFCLSLSLSMVSCGSDIGGNNGSFELSTEIKEDAPNTVSLNSSEIDHDRIYASYTINDGFFNNNRRTAVILKFYPDRPGAETIYFNQGEKLFVNGEHVPYYETTTQGRYVVWTDLEESDTKLEVAFLDASGALHRQNITLAVRPSIENYEFGDTSPELSEGLALTYSPKTQVNANFNVGGGECQNKFDHDSDENNEVISFGLASLSSDEEAAKWTSGETVYIRLRNQDLEQVPSAFSAGRVISNGYRNLELIVP